MSLQTGTPIAHTARAIIDPQRFQVKAYQVTGKMLEAPSDSFLLINDIREISPLGLIIDSSQELVASQDVLELQNLLDYHFELLKLKVFDQAGHKIGSVEDYSLETASFTIQQLVVKRPWSKSFFDPELLIHRSQIVEIDNQKIIIQQESEQPKARAKLETPVEELGFVNPFRKDTKPEVNSPSQAN